MAGGTEREMELLDSYLRAVKRYLPRGQADDIIKELGDDLRSQIDDKATELGRPLNDAEQMAIFKENGDPMLVARRYRQDRRSLSLGWELIGPELFPMYLIILCVNSTITVVAIAAIALFTHVPITIRDFYFAVVIQILCVTLTFIILNFIRRKFPQPWYYPPAELAPMMPISRWYSISGLILWSVVALWWLAIPHFPRVLLGGAAAHLNFSPTWHTLYVAVWPLLLALISQRVINLARPASTWILPVMRLAINIAGTCIFFFLVFKGPGLVMANAPQYGNLADVVNGWLMWGLFGPWLWMYSGVAALVYAWYCVPHLRRLLRREQAGPAATISEVPCESRKERT
jgi:hypothetical protein